MNYRKLGKTGMDVSEISLGTWQVGGKWGEPFDMKSAEAIIHKAIDGGVNFLDTADVYGEGMSEKAVGKVVKERKEKIYVASKAGKRLNPFNADGFTGNNIEKFIDDSLKNTGLEKLDLLQLHCPPPAVYQNQELFASLDKIKQKGKILHYGASVETVEEAFMALQYPGVETIQIIFNMFRLKPIEALFNKVEKNSIGFIVRVPLASGLLSGKYTKDTQFGKKDHRRFNRGGMFFDKGETFSGIDYNKGLEAVDELKNVFNAPENLYQYAIKWILMFDAVSCVIPGASKVSQAEGNLGAAKLPGFSAAQMKKVEDIYDLYFREDIHHLW
jgi:aryl-alcohol dehydrogenase-like predicted oxidoreductase